MVMTSIFADAPTTDDDEEDKQPQPPPPQPQPDPLAGQLDAALAANPVTGSGGGQPNQPQNPEWQQPQPVEIPGVTQPGTLLGQLQQERYSPADPLAGNVAPDAAQKLLGATATVAPMLAFGAPSAAAGMGLQSAASAAGAPEPVANAVGLLPFTGGNPLERVAQAGLGGTGGYIGQQADQALGLPQIPGLGGIGALAGGIGGMMAGGRLANAAETGVGQAVDNLVPPPDRISPTPITSSMRDGSPAVMNLEEWLGQPTPIEQRAGTPTTAPVETTPTSGVYPPPDSFASPEHQQGYYQGLLDSQQLPPHDFSPTRGPDDGDFQMGYKEARLGMPPGQLVNAPYGEHQPEFAQPPAGPQPVQGQPFGTSSNGPTSISTGAATPNPSQAINVQNAAQNAWMQQPGSNPFQPPNGGGGQPPSRGGGLPTGNAGGIDWNPIHNLMSAIGAPTQPLLTGLHLARFAPQELFRPSVLGNGLEAMGEAALKGKAPEVSAHINNDFGPNVPNGLRPADFKAASGNPPLNRTAVQWMIDHTPVVGPVLNRFREVNSALLGNMRDAHYLVEADKVARTDPGAGREVYENLWREANNATGHQTLVGNPDALNVSQGMGVGWSAALARVQELGNLIYGTGAPLPWAAGSRGAAFRSMMGVTAAMAATTMLGKELGAQVNTSQPFNKFGVDTSFLRPVTNNGLYKSVYGLNGAGYDTLAKGAANIGYHLFNGDEKGALDAALAFGRGEFGVVPSAVIDGILGQDWKGDPYTWQNFLNEAKTAFMGDKNGNFPSLEGRSIPIPAADIGKAVNAYGPEGALRAAPAAIASSVTTTPINTTSQAFKYAAPPDIIQKAGLPAAANGLGWNELLPTEKAAITRTLGTANPALLAQIQANSREQYPASAAHNEALDALTARKTAAEDRLLDLYNAGTLDKKGVVNAMRAVQSDYYTNKGKLDADPAYQAETANLRTADRTDAQKALDAYYAIGNNFTDKNQRQQEQAKYIQWLNGQDPKLASRIVNAVQPHNQTKLEAMYAAGAFN